MLTGSRLLYFFFFLYLSQNISYIPTLVNSFTENVSQQIACNHLNTSLSPFLRAYLLPALDIVRTQDRMLKPLSSSFPCNRRETFQVSWSSSTHSYNQTGQMKDRHEALHLITILSQLLLNAKWRLQAQLSEGFFFFSHHLVKIII